ncbi:hypothetical protein TNIN_127381 [Trichonephila inaurata madagascariensis]|uniref:Uncharacterized protein n=1 Tax=Trichonephila inaurata madagascariensis TaxID=2747483 RepID=A0A8X6MKY0_9ARAC|nr:hypothetical protein TNIN_127381 [Trichonephila inaurata madagascariensis]
MEIVCTSLPQLYTPRSEDAAASINRLQPGGPTGEEITTASFPWHITWRILLFTFEHALCEREHSMIFDSKRTLEGNLD